MYKGLEIGLLTLYIRVLSLMHFLGREFLTLARASAHDGSSLL